MQFADIMHLDTRLSINYGRQIPVMSFISGKALQRGSDLLSFVILR